MLAAKVLEKYKHNTMIDIKQIYYDLGKAMTGVCDRLYKRSRPKAIDRKVDSYLVVDMPYVIKNNELDCCGGYNDYTTTIQLLVYVRDKVSSSNANEFNLTAMDAKVKAVLSRFTISTDYMTVSNPRVMLQSDDGDGFGVTVIQGRLRTK